MTYYPQYIPLPPSLWLHLQVYLRLIVFISMSAISPISICLRGLAFRQAEYSAFWFPVTLACIFCGIPAFTVFQASSEEETFRFSNWTKPPLGCFT